MTDEERAQQAWPGLPWELVFRLGPLGSRDRANVLLYNRRDGRVTTGERNSLTYERDENGEHTASGKTTCFEGSLDSFADKVERDYRDRLANPSPYGGFAYISRLLAEYRNAIAFLRNLPEVKS